MRPDRARLSRGDLLLDALRTIGAKPWRALALGLAISLGVGAFVVIMSVSASANRQTARSVDSLRPELVRATPSGSSDAASGPSVPVAADSLMVIPGVKAAGVADTYESATLRARIGADPVDATLVGADGDLLGATRSPFHGTGFPSEDAVDGAHVAVIGAGVADRLALADPSATPTVWINGTAFTVVAVVDDSKYLADLIDSVIVPRSTAAELSPAGLQSTTAYLRTDRGAATQLGDDIPLYLSPEAPERWSVDVPRVPIDVTEAISDDLRSLTIALSVLVMAVGIVAVANAMMRSVYERTAEIGLRRALGARGSHIIAMVVLEAAIIGLTAGVAGAAAGAAAAVVISLRNNWPVVVAPSLLASAIAAAAFAGVAAGLFPGLRAVQVTPSEALRRE